MWNEPPVAWASPRRVTLSEGTAAPGPRTSTVPPSVPKAMVETGVLAFLAAVGGLGHLASDRVEAVGQQHDPGRCRLLTGRGGRVWLNVLSASRQAKTPSPIAVYSSSCRPAMARLTASRSWVGGTSTLPARPNFTSPRLIRLGSRSANSIGRLLGRLQPGRQHVGGLHRQRHVDGQHHRGPLLRHPDGRGRPGHARATARSAPPAAARRSGAGASRAGAAPRWPAARCC